MGINSSWKIRHRRHPGRLAGILAMAALIALSSACSGPEECLEGCETPTMTPTPTVTPTPPDTPTPKPCPSVYVDGDGDGFGTGEAFSSCEPTGTSTKPGDCDDTNPTVNPAATEVCSDLDGDLDEDCDGMIDDNDPSVERPLWYFDEDQDGFGGNAVSTYACEKPYSFSPTSDDCDDQNPLIHPGATEVCNGWDDDCDDKVDDEDDSTQDKPIFCYDKDNDGFGGADRQKQACQQPEGFVASCTDCDTNDPMTYPGADEVLLDGLDQNCDGQWDQVSRFAGVGPYNGDGKPGTETVLSEPIYVHADDETGDVYFSDTRNHRVRRLTYRNDVQVVETIAGNGIPGFSGDGGLATEASLNTPEGLTLDSDGNLFIADMGSQRIRKVDAAGIMSTVFGTGETGYDPQFEGKPGTDVNLDAPLGLAFYEDEGWLYVTDITQHRIWVMRDDNVYTVAGVDPNSKDAHPATDDNVPATQAILNSPKGITVDSNGDIYFVDYADQLVRRVREGYIETVAGTGSSGPLIDGTPATSTALWNPTDVKVTSDGTVFIADATHNSVRAFSLDDEDHIVTTVAGTGSADYNGDGLPAVQANLCSPNGIALMKNQLYIADTGNSLIRQTSLGGKMYNIAGVTGLGEEDVPALSGLLSIPVKPAVDPTTGDIYIADTLNNRIRRVDISTFEISTVAGTGASGYGGDDGAATESLLDRPFFIAVSLTGDLYISDYNNCRIRKVDSSGIINTIAGDGTCGNDKEEGPAIEVQINHPMGLVLDESDDGAEPYLYFVDRYNYSVRVIDPTGLLHTVVGGEGGTLVGHDVDFQSPLEVKLSEPRDLALGPNGELYVSDSGSHYIYKVENIGSDTDATISVMVGTGTPKSEIYCAAQPSARITTPYGLAVDPLGNLFISEYITPMVMRLSTDGQLCPAVGTGHKAGAPESGDAGEASLYSPTGLAIDPDSGNLYIADSSNNRILVVTP